MTGARTESPAGRSIRTPALPVAPPGWLATATFIVVSFAIPAILHFTFARVPSDADSAFHAAVGRLIAENGFLQAFPWTSMSWLADHYADKELLFHLLFVPLTPLPWITSAKIVGAIAGGAVLLSTYAVLRAEGVRFPGAWALLPLLTSAAFLYRFLLVRPHVLSIALAILTLWAAARGRLWLLALTSFLYPWTYVAWVLPLALTSVAEVARLLSGDRLRWKPAAVALVSLAAGVALHPNGANLLRFTWLQIGGALFTNAWGGRTGLEMGTEFEAFSPSQWAELLLLASAMALTAVTLAWRERRAGSVSLAFALSALAFGLATLRTARFVEYFVPLTVVALALALRPFSLRRLRFAPFALAGLALLYQGREEVALLARLREWPNRVPAYVESAMRSAIPPGAQVFTCEWGMTGYLMQALPGRRFLVALDPTFFQAHDPELYALWYAATRRPPPDVARLVRERFGARYVACFYDAQFEAFNQQLAATPGVRTLLVSDDWNLYDLGAP